MPKSTLLLSIAFVILKKITQYLIVVVLKMPRSKYQSNGRVLESLLLFVLNANSYNNLRRL